MNLPQAYLNRMKGQLGADFDAYLAAMDEPEKRAARANGLRLTPEAMRALRPGFVPVGGEGFLLPEGFAPGKDILHAAGAYYVQELSAQMPASLFELTPRMAVLDLCAAPGGKSSQLAAKVPEGVLFANEIVPNRANVLLSNLERMGAKNAVVTAMDPEKLISLTGPVFDAVLVDAPCAGEGMFRKEPEAVAAWSEEHVAACAKRQRAILTWAQRAVKPGGQLVYSTCSFSPAENEENRAWFLSAFPDFERRPSCRRRRRGFPAPCGCSRTAGRCCCRRYPALWTGCGSFGRGCWWARSSKIGSCPPTPWPWRRGRPCTGGLQCRSLMPCGSSAARPCPQTLPDGAP